MIESRKLDPIRYEMISLEGDSSGRTHRAIIFDVRKDLDLEVHILTARCKLPQWMTWTPTGHGSLPNWDLVTNDKSEQIQEGELALLVPRSLVIWTALNFFKTFFSVPSPEKLFYLEAGLDHSKIKNIDDASRRLINGGITKEEFDEFYGLCTGKISSF